MISRHDLRSNKQWTRSVASSLSWETQVGRHHSWVQWEILNYTNYILPWEETDVSLQIFCRSFFQFSSCPCGCGGSLSAGWLTVVVEDGVGLETGRQPLMKQERPACLSLFFVGTNCWNKLTKEGLSLILLRGILFFRVVNVGPHTSIYFADVAWRTIFYCCWNHLCNACSI